MNFSNEADVGAPEVINTNCIKESTSTRVRSEFLVNVLLLYRADYLRTLLILDLSHVLQIVSYLLISQSTLNVLVLCIFRVLGLISILLCTSCQFHFSVCYCIVFYCIVHILSATISAFICLVV